MKLSADSSRRLLSPKSLAEKDDAPRSFVGVPCLISPNRAKLPIERTPNLSRAGAAPRSWLCAPLAGADVQEQRLWGGAERSFRRGGALAVACF